MLRVGLTGGIGSGKSTAAQGFADLGVPLIDADAVARELTGPGQPAVSTISGHLKEDVSAADGSMDRVRVREIVFADPAKRSLLEAVLHPLIQAEMAQRIDRFKSRYCILEIPLLIEGLVAGKAHPLVDRIAVVHAPESIRIERVRQRSGLNQQQIQAIIDAQASDAQRKAHADDVLDNSGDLNQLTRRVKELHTLYSTLSRSTSTI